VRLLCCSCWIIFRCSTAFCLRIAIEECLMSDVFFSLLLLFDEHELFESSSSSPEEEADGEQPPPPNPPEEVPPGPPPLPPQSLSAIEDEGDLLSCSAASSDLRCIPAPRTQLDLSSPYYTLSEGYVRQLKRNEQHYAHRTHRTELYYCIDYSSGMT